MGWHTHNIILVGGGCLFGNVHLEDQGCDGRLTLRYVLGVICCEKGAAFDVSGIEPSGFMTVFLHVLQLTLLVLPVLISLAVCTCVVACWRCTQPCS